MGLNSDPRPTPAGPSSEAGRADATVEEPDNPWARIVGPRYTTESLARELGVSITAVIEAAEELRVLRLVTNDGVDVYPAFQVREGHLIPGLQPVLETLRTGVNDPWTWAQWLKTPTPRHDGGPNHSQLSDILAGDLDAVLNKARHDAWAWAS